MIINFIQLSVLLLLSAFFSGSETAFFSLDRAALKRFENSRPLGGRVAFELAKRLRRLLFVILFGNMVVNILFFAISFKIVQGLSEVYGAGAAVAGGAISLIVIITLGEVTPKSMAYHIPELWAKFAAIPLLIMEKTLSPIEWLAVKLRRNRSAETDTDTEKYSREDIREMLKSAAIPANTDPRLTRLVRELVDFSDIAVHEIMVPRVDVVFCRFDATLEDLADLVRRKKTKNIPVYGENRDEIPGIVSAKDVFAGKGDNIAEILKPVMFVPENKSVESLLNDFRKEKQTFAVVVNEYGGTEGIVTLEDVLEEIVGEIEDEFDRTNAPVARLSHNRWLVDASYSLRDFCEIFEVEADLDTADTIGGFVAALLGEIPRAGAAVDYGQLRMTLRKVHRNRPVSIVVETINREERP